MFLSKFKLLIVLVVILGSCKAPTDVVYFQGSKDLEKVPLKQDFVPTFKVDDIISIFVSASDMDAARPFNLMQGVSLGGDSASAPSAGSNVEPTYLIDQEGNIEFPVIGKLKISGLTRIQVKELIREKLKAFINDPIITVRLKNFKITVLGEVRTPGSFTIPNDRITVIEALGLAGDMTIRGKRTNIIVIKENNGENTYHRLDLTSKKVFDSPAYFLAQNDVLYVEPNEAQVKSSSVTSTNKANLVLSAIGILLAGISILF